MSDDSTFFSNNQETVFSHASEPVLFHSSEGGWSELYRVDKNGRFRVYKALKPQYRGVLLYETLLRKEFEIGYSLSHTGICEVYDFTEVVNLGNCIEMEWIDGSSLADILKSDKISSKQSKDIIMQLCSILSYLHSKQVIHRDIKPSNIMVTHNGKTVKLVDFGLSDTDSHTVSKSAAGTESYASPELLEGGKVDNRTDIYSLGKVIFLLSSSYSFIAKRCTKKDPGCRYQSVEDIATAVRYSAYRLIMPCFVVIAVLALALGLVKTFSQRVDDAEPDITIVDESSISDPATIDELFRQATDLIESMND